MNKPKPKATQMKATFVILDNREVRQIDLSADADQHIAAEFDSHEATFLHEVDVLPFDPGYTPSRGEALALEFKLPVPLSEIKTSVPTSIPKLAPNEISTPPRALVSVQLGSSPKFLFQKLSNASMLQPKRAILIGKNHFELNKQRGLIPGNRIDAIHQSGILTFKSESSVRRFLDLDHVFEEATDERLNKFFGGPSFMLTDPQAVCDSASSVVRRKVARLLHDDVKIDAAATKKAAKQAGLDIEVVKGKISVPVDRKSLRSLVDFLSDAYVESLMARGRIYYTNSARRVDRSN